MPVVASKLFQSHSFQGCDIILFHSPRFHRLARNFSGVQTRHFLYTWDTKSTKVAPDTWQQFHVRGAQALPEG
jgi:hypothetical protein